VSENSYAEGAEGLPVHLMRQDAHPPLEGSKRARQFCRALTLACVGQCGGAREQFAREHRAGAEGPRREGPLDHFAPRTPLPQPLFSRRPEIGQRSHIVARSCLCEIFSGDLKSIQTHSAASHHSFSEASLCAFPPHKVSRFLRFPSFIHLAFCILP